MVGKKFSSGLDKGEVIDMTFVSSYYIVHSRCGLNNVLFSVTKHILLLNETLCLSILNLVLNDPQHASQINGLSLLRTVVTCLSKLNFLEKLCPHISHLKVSFFR